MAYKLRIHHIDVGQGDATLIVLKNGETIEKAILIDTGCSTSALRVANYCEQKLRQKDDDAGKQRGAKKLDYLIFS
ncbi:MAG TPA: hypothetical protein VIE65_23195, partial [Methylobacter sp.]